MTTTLEALKATPGKFLKWWVQSREPRDRVDALIIACRNREYMFGLMREAFEAGRADAIAALQAEQGQEPIAYARKWFAEGEKPEKVKNSNGRWAWPKKFTFKETTKSKIFDDDVPLFLAPQPTPPAEQWVRVKERLHSEIMSIIAKPNEGTVALYCRENDLVVAYKLGHRDARHAAAELVAGFDSTDAGGKS